MSWSQIVQAIQATATGGGGGAPAIPAGWVLGLDARVSEAQITDVSSAASVWDDGTISFVQATAGERPALVTNAGLGGERVCRFDGSDDVMTQTAAITSATSHTAHMVVDIKTATAQRFFDSITGRIIYGQLSGNIMFFSTAFRYGDALTAGVHHLKWEADSGAGTVVMSIDGTAAASSAYVARGIGGNTGLGGDFAGNNNAHFDLAAFYIYDGIDAGRAADFEAASAGIWGV